MSYYTFVLYPTLFAIIIYQEIDISFWRNCYYLGRLSLFTLLVSNFSLDHAVVLVLVADIIIMCCGILDDAEQEKKACSFVSSWSFPCTNYWKYPFCAEGLSHSRTWAAHPEIVLLLGSKIWSRLSHLVGAGSDDRHL